MGVFLTSSFLNVWDFPQRRALSVCVGWKDKGLFRAIRLEEIQECHLVSGDFDYLLKTRVPDMSAYRKLLGETLLRLPGVNDTRTYVVMEEVKQSNRLVIKTR